MNYNRKAGHRIHPSTLEVEEFCGEFVKQNLQASINFMRKHSKMSADLAQGQLDLLIATNATDAEFCAFAKDVDAANDVWRSKK